MDYDNVKIMNVAVLCGIIWGTPIITGIFWLLTVYSLRRPQDL